MTCDTCRDHHTDFLEHALAAEQEQEMQAHLAACPRCAAELADLQATVSALRGLDAVAPPADLLDRIGAALDAATALEAPPVLAEMGVTPLPVPARRRWSWQQYSALGAAACALIGFVFVLRSGGTGIDATQPPSVTMPAGGMVPEMNTPREAMTQPMPGAAPATPATGPSGPASPPGMQPTGMPPARGTTGAPGTGQMPSLPPGGGVGPPGVSGTSGMPRPGGPMLGVPGGMGTQPGFSGFRPPNMNARNNQIGGRMSSPPGPPPIPRTEVTIRNPPRRLNPPERPTASRPGPTPAPRPTPAPAPGQRTTTPATTPAPEPRPTTPPVVPSVPEPTIPAGGPGIGVTSFGPVPSPDELRAKALGGARGGTQSGMREDSGSGPKGPAGPLAAAVGPGMGAGRATAPQSPPVEASRAVTYAAESPAPGGVVAGPLDVGETRSERAPEDAGVQVQFLPPSTRTVGQPSVAAVVLQADRYVPQVEVRVAPKTQVRVSNADGGVIYRGPLNARQRLTLPLTLIADEPGRHDVRIALVSAWPEANTSLDISVPDFVAAKAAGPRSDRGDKGGVGANGDPAGADVSVVLSEVDVREALLTVAQKGGLRMEVGPEIGGVRVNIEFRDIPAEAALRILCHDAGYVMKRENGVVRILRPTTIGQ